MFNLQSQLVLEYHHGGNQLQKSKHCAAPHHFVSLSFFEQGLFFVLRVSGYDFWISGFLFDFFFDFFGPGQPGEAV